MKKSLVRATLALAVAQASSAWAQPVSLASAPPVVVTTQPVAGHEAVDPRTAELRVTFSKPMQDGSWSWSTWGEETFPKTTGKPRYLDDARTCVLPVALEPCKFYALWLNSDRFKNFKDTAGRPAVPYLLTFTTSPEPGGATSATTPAPPEPALRDAAPRLATPVATRDALLNADQRLIVRWTDRQFRGFFDERTFDGWSEKDRAELETKSLDALQGPRSREYYQAINTLGALRSTQGLPRLRELACERRDKDNRDRWMAIRTLGLMGDTASVPELIPLVYHGNLNTRWWAQVSLVRLTGQNFGKDWEAWGQWWNSQPGHPPYQPELIRWWDGQATPDKLKESLDDGDAKFLEKLRAQFPEPSAAPAASSASP